MHIYSALIPWLPLLSTAGALVIRQNDQQESRLDRPYEVYFGVDGKTHGEKSKNLTEQGYRPISLSLSGTVASSAYAAVWVPQNGTTFQTIFDANASTYEAWVAEWRAKGYASTQIAATGTAESAIFAGVMEQTDVGRWFQSCGLHSPWDLGNSTGDVPTLDRGVRMYGNPGARRYCRLYHENFDNQQQRVFEATDEEKIHFDQVLKAEVSKRLWRPENLWVSNDGIISPTFTNTQVGTWVAFDGLTETELIAEIDSQQQNESRMPISLQGAGSGSDSRYNVVFAETHIPHPRDWSTTGSLSGFINDKTAQADLDEIFRSWMKKNGVRQAQFAMAINGTTIGERGYTLAEPGISIVQPDDVFLLASVSKLFSYASISHLLDEGLLNLTTAVYPFLGYKHADPRGANITVLSLINHTGGDDRDINGDVAFNFRNVAYSMPSNGSVPATLRDVIEYMIQRPLDHDPNTVEAYSNYGTMVMSYLVERITKTSYMDFLRANIFDGLDVRLYETAREVHENDNIVTETRLTGYDARFPQNWVDEVSSVHGGDGAIKEETAGAFSLAASASTIARFIGSHAVSGVGPRAHNRSRDGSLEGARTWAASGKVDWAVTLNTRNFAAGDQFEDLIHGSLEPFFDNHALVNEY